MKSHIFAVFPVFVLAVASLLVGCGLEKGLPQEVVVLSFPTDAGVYINGEAAGVTPLTVLLPRDWFMRCGWKSAVTIRR